MNSTFIMVIDSFGDRRTEVWRSLRQVGFDSGVSYNSLAEALVEIEKNKYQKGCVIVNLSEGILAVINFVKQLHNVAPSLSTLAIVDLVSLEGLRMLVHSGIDQFLHRPYSADALREKIHSADTFRIQVLSEPKKVTHQKPFDSSFSFLGNGFFRVVLRGFLNEDSSLPKTPPISNDSVLFVDCDLLLGMNSIGIRTWMMWFRSLAEAGFVQIIFENVRAPILRQAGMNSSFLPQSGTIRSFYIPYVGEANGDEIEFRFVAEDRIVSTGALPESQIIGQGQKSQVYRVDDQDLSLVGALYEKNKITVSPS